MPQQHQSRIFSILSLAMRREVLTVVILATRAYGALQPSSLQPLATSLALADPSAFRVKTHLVSIGFFTVWLCDFGPHIELRVSIQFLFNSILPVDTHFHSVGVVFRNFCSETVLTLSRHRSRSNVAVVWQFFPISSSSLLKIVRPRFAPLQMSFAFVHCCFDSRLLNEEDHRVCL